MNDESPVYYDLEGKAWRIRKRGKNKIWIRDPMFDSYDPKEKDWEHFLKKKLDSLSRVRDRPGHVVKLPKKQKIKEKKENE
ncbi:hypothetical protein J7L13_03675 [bacterium]|nr:hypothetical protein [bacterium]